MAGSVGKTKYTEQTIQNFGFDEVYKIPIRLGYIYNSVSGKVEPITKIQGNASYVLTHTDGKLTQIDMTIGEITYRQTLSYTGDDLTGVSAWSEV